MIDQNKICPGCGCQHKCSTAECLHCYQQPPSPPSGTRNRVSNIYPEGEGKFTTHISIPLDDPPTGQGDIRAGKTIYVPDVDYGASVVEAHYHPASYTGNFPLRAYVEKSRLDKLAAELAKANYAYGRAEDKIAALEKDHAIVVDSHARQVNLNRKAHVENQRLRTVLEKIGYDAMDSFACGQAAREALKEQDDV